MVAAKCQSHSQRAALIRGERVLKIDLESGNAFDKMRCFVVSPSLATLFAKPNMSTCKLKSTTRSTAHASISITLLYPQSTSHTCFMAPALTLWQLKIALKLLAKLCLQCSKADMLSTSLHLSQSPRGLATAHFHLMSPSFLFKT
jgi:hypothetical protein